MTPLSDKTGQNGRRLIPTLTKFMMRVDPHGHDGCWLWTGGTSWNGYGRIGLRRGESPRYAHRLAYELFRGAIPDGLDIDHLCRVRNCVNPEHLEAISHRENVLRGTSPSAYQARRTHCIRGHSFIGDNLYVTSAGRRQCKACIRIRYQRKTAA